MLEIPADFSLCARGICLSAICCRFSQGRGEGKKKRGSGSMSGDRKNNVDVDYSWGSSRGRGEIVSRGGHWVIGIDIEGES